jgi:hypothetical protein
MLSKPSNTSNPTHGVKHPDVHIRIVLIEALVLDLQRLTLLFERTAPVCLNERLIDHASLRRGESFRFNTRRKSAASLLLRYIQALGGLEAKPLRGTDHR